MQEVEVLGVSEKWMSILTPLMIIAGANSLEL